MFFPDILPMVILVGLDESFSYIEPKTNPSEKISQTLKWCCFIWCLVYQHVHTSGEIITTSLVSLTGIMVNKGNHPQMAELFRLVNYYNLPRWIDQPFFLGWFRGWWLSFALEKPKKMEIDLRNTQCDSWMVHLFWATRWGKPGRNISSWFGIHDKHGGRFTRKMRTNHQAQSVTVPQQKRLCRHQGKMRRYDEKWGSSQEKLGLKLKHD